MTRRTASDFYSFMLLLGGMWSCTSEGHKPAPSDAAPGTSASVRLLDTLALDVPDSAALGSFAYVTIENDGVILVSDVLRGRLLRYGMDGTLQQVIGQSGDGPGEFRRVSTARGIADDSLLAVVDAGRQYLSLLDRQSGAYIRGMSLPLRETGQTWSESSGIVAFGVQASPYLVGRLDWRTGDYQELGSMPAEILGAGMFVFMYGRVEALRLGSEFLVQVPMVPGLQLLDSTGTAIGTIDIPSERRRGTPRDLLARHMATLDKPFEYLGSVSAALDRLPDGNIAVLTIDLDLVSQQPLQIANVNYFITVLSADLERACVDLRVPYEAESLTPWPTFVAGRLVILSERLTSSDAVETTLRRFDVDVTGCRWVPTGGLQPPQRPGTRASDG